MAAHPILTVGDGIIVIPDELRDTPALRRGTQFEVLSDAAGTVILHPVSARPETAGDWKRLRGMLAHLDYSLNERLEAEKQLELASDKRRMSGTAQSE